MNDAKRMQISSFVDGELPDAEADLLLRRMGQDAELRRKAAEYLEIGRALRGERSVPGIDRLQERIAAEIDDKPLDDDVVVPVIKSGSAIRPLIGVAVAASVALVAIFGLQMTPGIDEKLAGDNTVAEVVEDPGYTVPQQVDEQLRQYYLSHGASSSELGANGMNARLVSLRLSDEALSEEDAVDSDEADDSADELPTQP
jgi:negative regulator of sigma E activity